MRDNTLRPQQQHLEKERNRKHERSGPCSARHEKESPAQEEDGGNSDCRRVVPRDPFGHCRPRGREPRQKETERTQSREAQRKEYPAQSCQLHCEIPQLVKAMIV